MNWESNRQSHLTIQQQIFNWIRERIERGEWTVGMKFPSQWKLALAWKVNRSTVQLVLEELKAEGLLESKVGSGVYVANNSWNVMLNSAQPNWTRHIESSIHEPNNHTIQLINEYEQKDNIIRLGTGELSPALLPTKQLEKSLKSISIEPKAIGYSPPQGSLKLRQLLCRHLCKKGIQTEAENILIVSGALQALQLIAIGVLEQHSIVFQEQSSYLHSIHPIQSAGMRIVPVSLDKKSPQQLSLLQGKRQSLLYCIPTLQNPTGRSWSLEKKKQVYDTCKKLRIPIIEDDVYSELLFDRTTLPMKSFDRLGQVLYIGSVSKTLSPGLRIGWIVGPTPVIEHLADIKMQTDYGSSAFSQEIVAYWLEMGLYDKHIQTLRQQLKKRATFVENILKKDFKKIAIWQTSEGGFYIWLRFNKPIVNKAYFLNLLK